MHWLSAALIFASLGLGFVMVQLVENPATRFDLTQTHKEMGILILALTIVRLCLRSVAVVPEPESGAAYLRTAAKAAHIALYGLIVVMPLSGWLMSSTTPVRVPTSVFSLFQLPYPLAPTLAAYRLVHVFHVVAAITLASLVVVHIGAALVHALWWRDRTLIRMWRTPSGDQRVGTGLSPR